MSSFLIAPPPRAQLRCARASPPVRTRRPTARQPPRAAREDLARRRSGGWPPPARRRRPAGTSSPFSPSFTTSATPPTPSRSPGVPTASDSTTVCGKFSHVDESRLASAARKSRSTSSRGKRAEEADASPSRSRSISARSGPSPATTESDAGHPRHGLDADLERLLAADPPGERERRALDAEGGRAPRRVSAAAADPAPDSGSRAPGPAARPTHTAMSRRYALGQMTRVARRSAASRETGAARGCGGRRPRPWNSSMSPSIEPAALCALVRLVRRELDDERPSARPSTRAPPVRSCSSRRRRLRRAHGT